MRAQNASFAEEGIYKLLLYFKLNCQGHLRSNTNIQFHESVRGKEVEVQWSSG